MKRKARPKAGPAAKPPIVTRTRPAASPADLMQAALDYASWAAANPLVTSKTLPSGEAALVRHDRPLTFEGLVTHASLDPLVLERVRTEAPGVFAAIRALFFDQQYSRAAVGAYDRHLVAAYFGLAERRHVEATVTVANLSDGDLDAELAELLATGGARDRRAGLWEQKFGACDGNPTIAVRSAAKRRKTAENRHCRFIITLLRDTPAWGMPCFPQ